MERHSSDLANTPTPEDDTPTALAPTALTLTNITKSFNTSGTLSGAQGIVRALDDAHLSVRTGTVHALLGENGAGKTTLMRIAFGMLTPDRGTITLHDTPRHFTSPKDAIAAGIGMVHQHFMLVPAMTVAENVTLGGHGRLDLDATRHRIRTVSAHTGLPIDPDATVATLPIGAQQRVEILKALTRDATLLILDEPTAVLTPVESRDLLHRMRELAQTGRTVILITHKLRDALEFADDVTVLRHGRTVLSAPTRTLTTQQLITAMLGTSSAQDTSMLGESPIITGTPTTPHPRATSIPHTRPVTLALDAVTVTDARGLDRLTNVTLRVHAGEIVGIAAVEGNGEAELLRVLAGRLKPTQGTVTKPDTVGFIPEDRHRDALLLDRPLTENVALRGAGRRRGMMRWSQYREHTRELLTRYDIRANTPDQPARTLSGGNQQKLVVTRELTRELPRKLRSAPDSSVSKNTATALVAENPTRGLDIHATAAVHQRLRDARDAGSAVVIYSSDLDEVMSLADRVIVVANGRVLEGGTDREQIGRAMVADVSTVEGGTP